MPADNRVMQLPLSKLQADEQYQPRATGLDPQHVLLLASSDPSEWPPLLVSPNDTGSYDIIDGFHRLAAAHRLGLSTLPCAIQEGVGYPEAAEANLRHGLPLSLADRKDYACYLHDQEPTLSLRAIARRCSLSPATVKATLEAAERDNEGAAHNAPPPTRPKPDPIERCIVLIVRARQQRTGVSFLGQDKHVQHVQRLINRYRKEDRAEVARALALFGQAFVDAARPYLPETTS